MKITNAQLKRLIREQVEMSQPTLKVGDTVTVDDDLDWEVTLIVTHVLGPNQFIGVEPMWAGTEHEDEYGMSFGIEDVIG